MDITQTCQHCNRPSETHLCWECTKTLRTLLLGVAELAEELEVQATRQSVGEKSPGGSSAETPLMFAEAASDAARAILEIVFPYAFELGMSALATTGLDAYAKISTSATYLASRAPAIAKLGNAGDVYDAIESAQRLALKAIDRPPNLIPLGDCRDCGRAVLSAPGWEYVQCPCGATYDVQGSREDIQARAREELVTGRQAEALGEIHGKVITRAAIWQWVRREKVKAVDQTPKGEHLFRFGDLLDLAKDQRAVSCSASSSAP